MKNCSYGSKKVTKVAVKGTLSEDCKVISFINDEKDMDEVSIERCLESFAGRDISFAVSLTEDEDMSDRLSE